MILAIVVSGSAAIAVVATVRSARTGAPASMAGVVMIGWVAGEILILTRDAELVSPTEAIYLAVGVAIAGPWLRVLRGGG